MGALPLDGRHPRSVHQYAALRLDRRVLGLRLSLKHLPVATMSLYAHVNPVIAVLLGTMVLREPFSGRIAAACGVVLAGSAIVKSAGK